MSRRVALFVGAAVVALLLLLLPRPATAATDVALPGCTSRCGNMSIPHPFGVEPGCYLPGLNVTCRNSKLFLGDGTVEVLKISIANNTVRINASFAYFPGSSSGKDDNLMGPNPITNGTWSGALGKGGVYTLGRSRNRLLAFGCNIQFLLLDLEGDGHGDPNNTTLLSTCSTLCHWDEHEQTWSYPGLTDECSGIACCQANVMKERSSYGFKVLSTNGAAGPKSEAIVWIVDSELIFLEVVKSLVASTRILPAVLAWRINHTTCHSNGSSAACRSSHSFCRNETDDGTRQAHICLCDEGYEGNPYIPNGCKDTNECDDSNKYPCYGVCSNTEGGYQCKCPSGFVGNASLTNGCKELLTRKRPTKRSSDGGSLVSHFASLVTEGDLVGIIDPQIMEEAEVEMVEEVVKLAAMCTKLNGEDRPTMREVEMTIENLRTTKKHTHHNIATKRDEKDQIVTPYISVEGLTMEGSTQYTTEEEMFLSGAYPR